MAKDIKTMQDLFALRLEDIYYTEERIVEILPKMIEKANSSELKQSFESRLVETQDHVKRIEQVFEMRGLEPQSVKCPAIDGILEEVDGLAEQVEDKDVLDVALIAAVQAVEQYEMTRYCALVAWARQLGREDCADVLQQNLEEVRLADEKLTWP